ncbi:MAG: biotin/lipoyl-binding protein [Lentimicrobiaceae bacterium]|nr:biotin/lipoyl-binding protein [Lentimicrobiaceae bacterium]
MPSKKIHKILVANRGEIAVRIINTLKKLSINSVAIYADNDADSLHCRLADEARPLGIGDLKDTYLNIQKIIDVALDAGADAIHPGYGFLSENADFAEACKANNLIFIGPDADSMRLMGDKIRARQFAIENDIPVVWGLVGSLEEIEVQAAALPYPVLIKASAGGGGKGMHIVEDASQLHSSLEQASREAERYFGNGQIFVEQYIRNPRHIEVQVLADHHGNAIHLYERECSVQRRYQKVIEESPSPTLTEERRLAICETAVNLCKKMNYNNAGTVEFIVDENQNFYFLEMNTRIQVEHPVTEQRTGIDIVEEQIRIARGKVMGYTQDSIVANGHAIECRIYAEDPENNFMPAPSDITLYHEPKMRGVRIDSSIDRPTSISDSYDPMISKLICHGKTRESAIEITRNALKDYILQTNKTNIPYLQSIIDNDDFVNNKIDTSYCEKHQNELIDAMHKMRDDIKKEDVVALFLFYDFNKRYLEDKAIDNVWEEVGYWRYNMNVDVEVLSQRTTDNRQQSSVFHVQIERIRRRSLYCNINGQDYEVLLSQNGEGINKVIINGMSESVFVSETSDNNYCVHFRGLDFICRRNDELNDSKDYSNTENKNNDMTYHSPMPGKVIKVNVKEGDDVKEGDILCVVEAMKMENNIKAMTSGKVDKIFVNENDKVDVKTILIELAI